jgi:predicted nuclease of predicted toxin-antitoxin system
MRFFLDHCVPASVADVLTNAGHEVIVQKTAIPQDSSDTMVAIASAANEAILVSFDKDFKAIATRFGVSQKRLRKLSRVAFLCSYPQASKRLEIALPFIAAEWEIAQKSTDTRMFIEIQGAALKTVR